MRYDNKCSLITPQRRSEWVSGVVQPAMAAAAAALKLDGSDGSAAAALQLGELLR